jgi:hypothetical protein
MCSIDGEDVAGWLVRNRLAFDWPRYSKGRLLALRRMQRRSGHLGWIVTEPRLRLAHYLAEQKPHAGLFYEVLKAENDLGMIVRARIHAEGELKAVLLKPPSAHQSFKRNDFDYDQKVQLASDVCKKIALSNFSGEIDGGPNSK